MGLPTRKLAVLGVLVTFLAVLLAPTVNAYLKEQAEIDALEQEVEQQKKDLERLEGERAAWDDPRYVEHQARERLRFVKPGERTYVVVNNGGTERAVTGVGGNAHVAVPVDTSSAWYGEVWQSVKVAAQGPAGGVEPRTPPATQNPSPAPSPAASGPASRTAP